MCKAIDAAMTMVNRSIDIAKETGDRRYLTNFYKLHKLLYYAQGYMLAVHHNSLFEEEIELHRSGPFIHELLSLPCGYDTLTQKFPTELFFPLTQDRVEAIDGTIETYGKYAKDELVRKSKGDRIYLDYLGINGTKGIIPRSAFEMEQYKQIFTQIRFWPHF